MPGIRNRHVYTALLFVLALCAISAAALARGPNGLPSPELAGPMALRCVALTGNAILAAAALVMIRRIYGPVMPISFRQANPPPDAQPATAQPSRRARNAFVYLLIVLAVGVIIIGTLARQGSLDRRQYTAETDEQAPAAEARPRGLVIDLLDMVALLASLAAAGASVVYLAYVRSRVFPMNRRLESQARVEEASHREIPIPENAQPHARVLARLGFSRLGEAHALVPSSPISPFIHVLIGPGRQIAASIITSELVPQPSVLLTSFFDGDAVLETRYPSTLTIKHPDYDAAGSPISLDEAYEKHRQRLPGFAERHGPPRLVETMQQYLDRSRRADTLHREEFLRANNNEFIGAGCSVLVIGVALLMMSLALLGVASLLKGLVMAPAVLTLAFILILLGNTMRMTRKITQAGGV